MIEPLRHLKVFSPNAWGNKRVDVIGCGATGSRIAMSLAKLGITNIHIWDFDKIENHNIANQLFGNHHVGMSKTEALSKLIMADTGTQVTVHSERVTGTETFGTVVFLLTDTMSSRKEIWDNGIKNKIHTRLLIETRMGAADGRVYAINPLKPNHVKAYESTLYSDEVAETSACGASTTVGPTAETISGLAVWQIIRWFAIENGDDDELDNETIFGLKPTFFMTKKF